MINRDNAYVTTTEGMRGWFAVLMWLNTEDQDLGPFWEPWETGFGRYSSQNEAIAEAEYWAVDLGIPYKQ